MCLSTTIGGRGDGDCARRLGPHINEYDEVVCRTDAVAAAHTTFASQAYRKSVKPKQQLTMELNEYHDKAMSTNAESSDNIVYSLLGLMKLVRDNIKLIKEAA